MNISNLKIFEKEFEDLYFEFQRNNSYQFYFEPPEQFYFFKDYIKEYLKKEYLQEKIIPEILLHQIAITNIKVYDNLEDILENEHLHF